MRDKKAAGWQLFFMSAKDENKNEAMKAGADVFFGKGMPADQMLATIQRALSLRRPVVTPVVAPDSIKP